MKMITIILKSLPFLLAAMSVGSVLLLLFVIFKAFTGNFDQTTKKLLYIGLTLLIFCVIVWSSVFKYLDSFSG